MKLVKRGKEKSGPLAPVSRAFSPFWPMQRLQSEIDGLFEEPFGSWLAPSEPFLEAWMPAVEVLENKNNVLVKAELPGMEKEEFEVYVTGKNLNIAGARKVDREDESAEVYRSERYYGRFHRSIPLPAPVATDKIDAHYKDGILTITCPKTAEAKRKKVEVKVN